MKTLGPIKLEQRKVADLIPYARNSRTHSDEQVAQIAASIKEFGFTNPILTDGENGIIAGHGRLQAARKLGLAEVPTIPLAGLTDAQKRAYVIADNKLALNAGWDAEMLSSEIAGLGEDGFDLALLGFNEDELAALLGDGESESGMGAGRLSDQFLIPPFSVLNAREGWWQDRKRAWLALGIKSELGRGGGQMTEPTASFKNQDKLAAMQRRGAAPGGSARPACDYSKRQRGDGKGRPI